MTLTVTAWHSIVFTLIVTDVNWQCAIYRFCLESILQRRNTRSLCLKPPWRSSKLTKPITLSLQSNVDEIHWIYSADIHRRNMFRPQRLDVWINASNMHTLLNRKVYLWRGILLKHLWHWRLQNLEEIVEINRSIRALRLSAQWCRLVRSSKKRLYPVPYVEGYQDMYSDADLREEQMRCHC